MGSNFDKEIEINRIMDAAKEEYIKQTVRLFNEAYLLGRQHAEAAFAEEEE